MQTTKKSLIVCNLVYSRVEVKCPPQIILKLPKDRYFQSTRVEKLTKLLFFRMQNQKQAELSKKARGILFQFKNILKENSLNIQQLIFQVFTFQRQNLSYSEFATLVKYLDDRLPYDQIDTLIQELDSLGEGQISMPAFTKILKTINENDDPFKSGMDAEAENIVQKSRIGGISEKDEVVLILKQIKDNLKNTDPYQLLDLVDYDRDGQLSAAEFEELVFNCGLYDQNKRAALKKHLFQESNKITFKQIISALQLDNLPKRVSFADIDNKTSHIRQPNPIKENKPKKPAQVSRESKIIRVTFDEPHKEEVDLTLQRYINYASVMSQPLKGMAAQYLNKGQLFVDNKNPGLGPNLKYEHAKQLFKKHYSLFEMVQSVVDREKSRIGLGQLLQAKDIIQGSLGDCYFLSSVAGVVQHYPELIYKLFVLDTNPSDIYGIRLFIDGEWNTLITDARFPANNYNQFVYAKPHGNELWVLLLQKAWAKVYGSYLNIVSGCSSQGMIALTGAPVVVQQIKNNTDLSASIEKNVKRKFIISASGSDKLSALSNNQQERYGLYSAHAYSVLKVFPGLKANGKTITLLKLRNPWGSKPWKGDWSFASPLWTPELRNQLNYNRDPDDGSFYMLEQHFRYFFNNISTCYVYPNYVNSSVRIQSHRNYSVMFSFSVQKEGEYTLSLYQDNPRKYKNSGNYETSKARLFTIQVHGNNNYELVASKATQVDNLHQNVVLKPGNYMISAKIKWKFSQRSSFVLTSYGPASLTFKQVNKDKNCLKNSIISTVTKNLAKAEKSYYSPGGAYRAIQVETEKGYGFVAVVNPGPKTMKIVMNFNQVGGMKPIKPQRFPLEFNMPPGTTDIRPLLIDPSGYRYSMQQRITTLG